MDLIFTLETAAGVAAALFNKVGAKKVFALHGGMGAGKTTFVHFACAYLGVEDSVSSPTFPIINEYETNTGDIVFHIDLYRLSGIDEARQAGVGEAIDSGNTCFVEWPERASGLFPDGTVHLYLSVLNDTTRSLRIGD